MIIFTCGAFKMVLFKYNLVILRNEPSRRVFFIYLVVRLDIGRMCVLYKKAALAPLAVYDYSPVFCIFCLVVFCACVVFGISCLQNDNNNKNDNSTALLRVFFAALIAAALCDWASYLRRPVFYLSTK